MVNLLPEEMKKGDQEEKGFEPQKKKEEKAENVVMTTPIKDKFFRQKKKSQVSFNPWSFIFRKKKKNQLVKDSYVHNDNKQEEENTSAPKEHFLNIDKKEKEKEKEKKDISENFNISLMPQQTMVISRVIRSRLLFLTVAIVLISALFFISRLYGNWYFSKLESEVEYLKREIILLEAQSKPFLKDRDDVAALANKAEEVKKALNEHIYWTNFFDFLEVYTVPDVYFGDFRGQAGETIVLAATSRDLISLARQIVVFNDAPDFIKKLDVSGVQKIDEGVSAFFNLTLVEGVWQK